MQLAVSNSCSGSCTASSGMAGWFNCFLSHGFQGDGVMHVEGGCANVQPFAQHGFCWASTGAWLIAVVAACIWVNRNSA